MNELILASSSIYRAELLRRLCLPFNTIDPAIDETPVANESPKDLVSRLSLSKAEVVSQRHPQAVVIGSDQVCALGNEVCGKPLTPEWAVEQLQSFSNKCITFFTGLCVLTPSGDVFQYIDETIVEFRKLSVEEIRRYVELEEPLDCAGAFKVEALGIGLFKSVKSNDPTALMGLPLIRLAEALRQNGFQIP